MTKSQSLWLSDLVNLWPSAVRSLILLVIGQLGSGNLKDTHWNGLDILILQAKEWKTLLVVNSVLPLTAPVTQFFCKDKTCSLETQLCITVPERHSITNCCEGWTKTLHREVLLLESSRGGALNQTHHSK